MYYLCQLSFDIHNIFQPDIFGKFLGLFDQEAQNINQIIYEAFNRNFTKH